MLTFSFLLRFATSSQTRFFVLGVRQAFADFLLGFKVSTLPLWFKFLKGSDSSLVLVSRRLSNLAIFVF